MSDRNYWQWISVAAVLGAAALAHTASASSGKGAKFDPPDLNLEYQLHRQFVLTQGKQGNVAPRGLNESYNVQKDETLWTLSQMLYGDGQYWPRVWAQNKNIANPHLVRPGHQLQFLMGSEDETPAFRFSEDGDESGLELTAAQFNGQNPIVDIPPPEVPPKPVLNVPSSFPEWQSVYKKRGDSFIDDRGIKKYNAKVANQIYLRGYVQEGPVQSLGTYLENDAEAGLPITNQYVYVKVKRGVGHAGKKMLVVKDQGQLTRLNKQWDPEKRPYLVQIMAEIELRETTPAIFKNSKDREGYEAYRALVTKATGLAANDCELIDGSIKEISLEMNGPHGTTQAQVIGSEKHSASALFAPGDLVFLNKGSAAGLEVGQLLNVFADRSIRRTLTVVPLSPVPSGTVKIVKVTNTLATAVLLEARDSIQQGDMAKEMTSRRDSTEELEHIRGDGPSAADDENFGETSFTGEPIGNGGAEGGGNEQDSVNIENEIQSLEGK